MLRAKRPAGGGVGDTEPEKPHSFLFKKIRQAPVSLRCYEPNEARLTACGSLRLHQQGTCQQAGPSADTEFGPSHQKGTRIRGCGAAAGRVVACAAGAALAEAQRRMASRLVLATKRCVLPNAMLPRLMQRTLCPPKLDADGGRMAATCAGAVPLDCPCTVGPGRAGIGFKFQVSASRFGIRQARWDALAPSGAGGSSPGFLFRRFGPLRSEAVSSELRSEPTPIGVARSAVPASARAVGGVRVGPTRLRARSTLARGGSKRLVRE